MAKRLILLCFTIFTLVFWLSYYVATNSYCKSIDTATISLMGQIVENASMSLEDTIDDLRVITSSPYYFESIQDILLSASPINNTSDSEMRYFFVYMRNFLGSQNCIGIFTRDGELIYDNEPITGLGIFSRNYDTLLEHMQGNKGEARLISQNEKRYPCALVRTISDLRTREHLGMIVVLIRDQTLADSFENISDIAGGRAVIVDSLHNVTYDTAGEMQGRPLEEDMLLAKLDTCDGDFFTSVNGTEYIGIKKDQRNYSILIYSRYDDLMHDVFETRFYVQQGYFIINVLWGIMIIFMINRFMHPLKDTVILMQKVQQGDQTVRIRNIKQQKDEMKILAENFNVLMDRVQAQMEENTLLEIEKKQLEIDALQSQINPHFMYNTLESIRVLADECGENQIERLVSAFAKLMRYNITAINEETTIQREIEYIQNYLYIQNVRFKNRFHLEVSVEENLNKCKMIKLLIQPLVENAIMHGLECSTSSGNIRIKVSSLDDVHCKIVVCDDGSGMTKEKIMDIEESLLLRYVNQKDARNIGIRNVNERIKLFYGKNYGLKFESEPGKGTIVTMVLPLQKR